MISNKIWALMLISILLNLAAGIVYNIPGFGDALKDNVYGISYDNSFDEGWEQTTNETIGIGEDQSSTSSSFTNIPGWAAMKGLVKFFRTIDNYMFGFYNLLYGMFYGPLQSGGTNLGKILFNGLKSVIFIGYIILAFKIWTGKNVEGN